MGEDPEAQAPAGGPGAPQEQADPALAAAVDALTEPGRLRAVEHRVARIAPQLQRILDTALEEGGWFDEAHRGQVLKAATTPDPDERVDAVRSLLAEETRIGMMVGVAVGWELARELEPEATGGESARVGAAEAAAGADDPGQGPGAAAAGDSDRQPGGTR